MNYYTEFLKHYDKLKEDYCTSSYASCNVTPSYFCYYGRHLFQIIKYLEARFNTTWLESDLDTIIAKLKGVAKGAQEKGVTTHDADEVSAVVYVCHLAINILSDLKKKTKEQSVAQLVAH